MAQIAGSIGSSPAASARIQSAPATPLASRSAYPDAFIPGGAGDHLEVGHDGARGGAVERLLEPAVGDRCAVGRVAVHRGRGRDHHVRPTEAVGGKFGQVVDRPGSHGNRDGLAGRESVL